MNAAYHVPVVIQLKCTGLRLEDCTAGDVQIVRCSGRITAGNEIQFLLDHGKERMFEGSAIVLNLSGVSYIDSSGLGGLVRLLNSCRRAHGDLKLCNLPQIVRQTLHITHLHTLFEVYDSEMKAVTAFGKQRQPPEDAPCQSQLKILCLHDSVDVLAYVRTLLKSAGYDAVTTTAIPDAVTFLTLGGTKLVLIGTTMTSVNGRSILDKLKTVAPDTPIHVLEGDFANREPGEVGSKLLQDIRELLSK